MREIIGMDDTPGEKEDPNHRCEGPFALALEQGPPHTAFCPDQGSCNMQDL